MNSSLIHVDGKILAAIDASVYADSVAAHAAWAASRLGAPLQLLHTIERASAARGADLSGNLAADDREALLLKLTELDEQRGKLAQQHGQLLLQEQQAKVREQHGVEADLLQRHGELVDSLLELESGVRSPPLRVSLMLPETRTGPAQMASFVAGSSRLAESITKLTVLLCPLPTVSGNVTPCGVA